MIQKKMRRFSDPLKPTYISSKRYSNLNDIKNSSNICIVDMEIIGYSIHSSTRIWYYDIQVTFTKDKSKYQTSKKSNSFRLPKKKSMGDETPFNDLYLLNQVDSIMSRYTIRRRYKDFLKLYQEIILFIPRHTLPRFNETKDLVFSICNTILRCKPPDIIFERRCYSFNCLLGLIKENEFLKNSIPFLEFIGQPPETLITLNSIFQTNYVSLKEYSASSNMLMPNRIKCVQRLKKVKSDQNPKVEVCSRCEANTNKLIKENCSLDFSETYPIASRKNELKTINIDTFIKSKSPCVKKIINPTNDQERFDSSKLEKSCLHNIDLSYNTGILTHDVRSIVCV